MEFVDGCLGGTKTLKKKKKPKNEGRRSENGLCLLTWPSALIGSLDTLENYRIPVRMRANFGRRTVPLMKITGSATTHQAAFMLAQSIVFYNGDASSSFLTSALRLGP